AFVHTRLGVAVREALLWRGNRGPGPARTGGAPRRSRTSFWINGQLVLPPVRRSGLASATAFAWDSSAARPRRAARAPRRRSAAARGRTDLEAAARNVRA